MTSTPILLLGSFLGTVAAGVVIGLFAYGRFLSLLRELEPAEFEELGRPALIGTSPQNGLRLQRFIYTNPKRDLNRDVEWWRQFLRIFTPLLLLALALQAIVATGWFLRNIG